MHSIFAEIIWAVICDRGSSSSASFLHGALLQLQIGDAVMGCRAVTNGFFYSI